MKINFNNINIFIYIILSYIKNICDVIIKNSYYYNS